ncbi:MAG: Holliday junction resolvase Hjc [Candidatus Nanoarchaeia archaeon]
MSTKSRGTNAERDLVHKFWAASWACFRAAGSGSNKYPTPDLIAGNNLRKLCIEVKLTTADRQYFDKKEIEDLKLFGSMFGAEPWVAIKFSGKDWFFLMLEDLEETPKLFVASLAVAERRGLKFEEIVKIK